MGGAPMVDTSEVEKFNAQLDVLYLDRPVDGHPYRDHVGELASLGLPEVGIGWRYLAEIALHPGALLDLIADDPQARFQRLVDIHVGFVGHIDAGEHLEVADDASAGHTITAADDSVIAGFTITGGYRGINCHNASPVIRNCIIKNNAIEGIHLKDSKAVISNCTFTRI